MNICSSTLSFRIASMCWLTILCGVCYHDVSAQQASDRIDESEIVPRNPINFKMTTLGGKQFWTDIHYFGGWRIQENAVTGHFRLIDQKNHRHSWGTLDDCRTELEEQVESGKVRPTAGKIVVVLHGLVRSTDSMSRLGSYLEKRGDYTAVDFEYASTRRRVADHAAALNKVVQSLGPDVTEINFVAHSLGNIVVRHYLADQAAETGIDKRIRRMVMIGPPNQGSKMARVLKRSFLFNVIAGSSGMELGAGWEKLEPKLATPDFEFGIIAGGQSEKQKLSNFILSGKDDFTVSLDEVRLVGAKDFLVKPLFHSTMMRNPVTLEATLSFLDNGFFVSSDAQNPIE